MKGFARGKRKVVVRLMYPEVTATFYKYNGIIYNVDSKHPSNFNVAAKSSRYTSYKEIIDAAIEDLSDPMATDGKWVWHSKYSWLKVPVSVGELMGLGWFDDRILELIDPGLPTYPLEKITIFV